MAILLRMIFQRAAAHARMIWITHTQGGFAWAKNAAGSQGLLNLHYIFMTVAWPICMFEAIFSYRMPIYKLPHRK